MIVYVNTQNDFQRELVPEDAITHTAFLHTKYFVLSMIRISVLEEFPAWVALRTGKQIFWHHSIEDIFDVYDVVATPDNTKIYRQFHFKAV